MAIRARAYAISNAVNAGKTVTVHEREVSVPGWTGTGYMVIDPVTGDGAYMISGGGNGGWAEIIETGLIPAFIDVFAPRMVSILYSMITAFNDMLACVENGNYFAVAAFIIMSLVFIYYMSWIMTLAMAGGVGLILMGLFATTMELMYNEMNASILETC